MADRVKDDPNLEESGEPRTLERPIIIVEQLRDSSQRYRPARPHRIYIPFNDRSG